MKSTNFPLLCRKVLSPIMKSKYYRKYKFYIDNFANYKLVGIKSGMKTANTPLARTGDDMKPLTSYKSMGKRERKRIS